MKIVNICLNSVVTRGFSYQDNLLPKYQAELGNEVCIITNLYYYNKNGKLEKFKKNDIEYDCGVKIIRISNKRGTTFQSKFKRYENFIPILEQEKPDIIFLHDCQFIDVKQVIKYVKVHKKTILYVDNHADYSNSARNWLSKNILHKIVWRHYARELNPFVKKFYGVTPARVDFLTDLYKLPKDKCELLVMGADDELVKLSKSTNANCLIRQKYNIAATDFLIVTGGKIDLAKTQTLLLMKAVREMNNPKVKLIVFGSVVDELKQQVNELSDGHIIQYIGWISSADSYNYFEASDLVIFPGRHSVFWEQVVGQGKPMVVKYWDGTTHIDLGGNVKYLYNDSVSEIKNVIIETMNPITYDKMKAVAEEKGITHFSYKEIAKRSIIC